MDCPDLAACDFQWKINCSFAVTHNASTWGWVHAKSPRRAAARVLSLWGRRRGLGSSVGGNDCQKERNRFAAVYRQLKAVTAAGKKYISGLAEGQNISRSGWRSSCLSARHVFRLPRLWRAWLRVNLLSRDSPQSGTRCSYPGVQGLVAIVLSDISRTDIRCHGEAGY